MNDDTQGELVTFDVPPEFDRVRADKVAHHFRPELSRNQIQRFFEMGLVWRDEKSLIKSDKVNAGETLAFTIPPARPHHLEPADIPLDILYEDEDIVLLNKPVGMIVHPGAGTGNDTLVHALLHHCKGELSGIAGVERPGIVHRLDKDTSGVMVVAKSDPAFLELARMFSERRLEKVYLALATGAPRLISGKIDQPIGRHPVHRHKMAVREGGRNARTDWRMREKFETESHKGEFALLEIQLHTGRTHQIRVHLAHMGFPLAGDIVYGYRAREEWEKCIPRVMLHASRLSFDHPVTGEPLEVTAPLPPDFQGILETLRQTHKSRAYYDNNPSNSAANP